MSPDRSRRKKTGTASSKAARVPGSEPLAVSVACDGVRVAVASARVADLARHVLKALGVRQAMLSITFVTPRSIARLNRLHLGHSGPTDVITFELAAPVDRSVLGDIYICPAVARKNAVAMGVGVREELARLVVHGILHACGWEHPEDESRTASRMWRRQEQMLRRFWISRTPET